MKLRCCGNQRGCVDSIETRSSDIERGARTGTRRAESTGCGEPRGESTRNQVVHRPQPLPEHRREKRRSRSEMKDERQPAVH